MRLITLGDSLTNGDWNWPTPLAQKLKCPLINFAIPGTQNALCIQKMQDFILNDELKEDDIVIWEMTLSWKPVVRIRLEHLEEAERIRQEMKENNSEFEHFALTNYKNKIDDKHRIDLIDISPMLNKFILLDAPRDIPNQLQNLLFMFYIVKKMCPRLLVIQAKKIFIKDEDYWVKMREYLKEKDIEFVDEGILDWCEEMNLDFKDPLHPTPKSMSIYAMQVLHPKLKQLGWL